MKTLRTTILTITVLVLAASSSAGAQTAILQPGGDDRIVRLQNNCSTIQPNLTRIHTNDALIRHNVGQYYNNISTRLMARLNSRLALNQIDSIKFVEIAQRFEQSRLSFSANYNNYEEAMSSLLAKSCLKQPTDFYASLIIARDARQKLANSVKDLDVLIGEYRTAVEELTQRLNQGQNI